MNKHLLSAIAAFLIVFSAFAQNFSITYPTTTYTGDPSVQIDALVKVINASSNTVEVLAERRTNNVIPPHESNFCWGPTCYSPFINISTDTVVIAPGGEDNSFKGTLSAFGSVGTSVVEYCFYEHTSPQDSICVTFTYIMEVTSLNELSEEKTFSLPYPNPASQMVMFRYDLAGYNHGIIRIHNMLGSVIKEIKLADRQAVMVIPVKDLQAGIYFVSLVADNQKLVTRRLVVSHK